jgi:hypothetical protein
VKGSSMRTATLWSVMLAASLAACGSDAAPDDKKAPAGTEQDEEPVAPSEEGPGLVDEQPNVGGAACELAQGGGLAPYDGEYTWTVDDFQACRTACPDFDSACITTSCAAGFDVFDGCVGVELNACMTAQGGPCRSEFEAHLCCADENCDLSLPTQEAQACVAAECSTTRDAFGTCGTETGIEDCIVTAVPRCLLPGEATEATGDGTTTDEGAIPSELASWLQLRSLRGLTQPLVAQSALAGSAE